VPEDQRHGTPKADSEDSRYRLRQTVTLRNAGILHRVCGSDTLTVNSLHSFLIDDLACGLIPEAVAQDGTIEAASVKDASAFALGTMFHPEYWAASDHGSARIVTAFGEAVTQHARLSSDRGKASRG